MGLSVTVADGNYAELLEGQRFAVAGLHGVVEADFFNWPATSPDGAPVLAGIARRIATFDWSNIDRDVLKALYESVIDIDTRRRLGEYYTPDWLAQKMVEEHFDDPLNQRLLDPACGSGTFLFWAVRRALAACDEAGISNRDALERVVAQVHGMDLHPVAVTLARVNYLLALTPERLADRRDLTVPVFLGDSVRWEHDDVRLSSSGICVRTSDELELFHEDLHFPEAVIEEPARFDRLVADLATRAAKRKRGSKAPSIVGILNRHSVAGEADRAAMTTAFHKLCRLHDQRRDHVWSYYIRNRARPLAFTRENGQADLLLGNPPWLAYRAMPRQLQKRYRTLAQERGLWVGGKVATHQDLSDLFVARAVEQYLKQDGVFSFVMPFATLSRRQFSGFRSGEWTAGDIGARAHLSESEEFARVKPPPFQVPACIITGRKSGVARALPVRVKMWTGRLPSPGLDWPSASEFLTAADGEVAAARDEAESPYRRRFQQGASLVPRMLVTVTRQPSGPLGVVAGRAAVRSARSANEKRPWKDLGALEGVVEEEFLKRIHVGATILAFRPREPALAVIPWSGGRLLAADDDRLDEFPGLAHWWRLAERVWDANKGETNSMSLTDQIDFRNKLSQQFPLASQRVVYTKSGQHLAACRIEDPSAVIDHKLYWSPVTSVDEGRYLCAVLNSRVLAERVSGLQARGQHNPRDFDLHVFALPFPLFDSGNSLHLGLAAHAARAERIASSICIAPTWQFQKARRVVREALREDGVEAQIDAMVDELVTDALSGVPDLLRTFSTGTADARARRIAGRRRPANRDSPAQDIHRAKE
jgi:hypothetical protein